MTKIAVFERFYHNHQNFGLTKPVESTTVIDSGLHDIVADANTVSGAALHIVDMNQGKIEIPELIILGTHLDDELSYLARPATVSEEIGVPGKTFLGKPKQAKELITTLLPMPDKDGTMVLPTSHSSPVSRKEVEAHAQGLEERYAAEGWAPYIISHLARMMLPSSVGILGVSSINLMEGLPIDEVIGTRDPNFSESLHRAINSYSDQQPNLE